MNDSAQDIQRRLGAVAGLLRSDGWRMMDLQLEAMENQARQAMYKAPDAYTAAKHMGALKALEDMRTWPRREFELASSMLTPPTQ